MILLVWDYMCVILFRCVCFCAIIKYVCVTCAIRNLKTDFNFVRRRTVDAMSFVYFSMYFCVHEQEFVPLGLMEEYESSASLDVFSWRPSSSI